MPRKPPQATSQEILRDEQLVSCDLLRNLGRLLLDAVDTLLLGGPGPGRPAPARGGRRAPRRLW